MSVIDKIHMLKKILKEAKNIVAWQADIFTDLNVHKGDPSAHHAKTGDNEVYGLLLTGVDAAKPAAGIVDRWYFATDTLILYRDNGTSWVEAARGETAIRLAQLAEKAHGSLTGVTASQHHTKTTLFSELTDRWTLAQAHRGADDKIMVFKGPAADPVEEDKYTDAKVNAIIAAKMKAGTVTDTTGTDGKISVTFAEAFASTPVVMVQLEGDVDYYPVVTAKSTTGFTVKMLKTAHKHSQGNTGAEASHYHGISFGSGAGSSHSHSNPNTSAVSAGTPSGSISSDSAGTPEGATYSESSHTHGISLTSGAGSAHAHSQDTTGWPSDTQSAIYSLTREVCASAHSNCVVSSYSSRNLAAYNHIHTNPATNTESSHSHSVSGTSGAGLAHSHGFVGVAMSGHSHTFTGSALGTHSHTIGDTGYESAHTHSVSGTSGAGSSHSHSNPDTAQVNAGNTLVTTEVTFSYIAMLP